MEVVHENDRKNERKKRKNTKNLIYFFGKSHLKVKYISEFDDSYLVYNVFNDFDSVKKTVFCSEFDFGTFSAHFLYFQCTPLFMRTLYRGEP